VNRKVNVSETDTIRNHQPVDDAALDFDPVKLEAQPDPVESAAPDPFDPETLRLTQGFTASVGVKKALLSIPVRKPNKAEFVRAHPSESYRLTTAVVELKEERETYIVAPALRPELTTEATFRPKLLVTAISRQNVLFLWECNLPRADGRADEWSRTMLEAVHLATTEWVRVVANQSLGAYDVFRASAQLSEPEWPETPFKELLRIAFRDRLISSLDHPVLRRLRGES
jgi:hypothetical protein